MKIQFECPKCRNNVEANNVELAKELQCGSCKNIFSLRHFPGADPKELRQCPLCEAAHLYTQKNFPKKLGIGIVAVAGIITILWDHKYYFTLMATALIDFIIYQKCPNLTRCYLCKAAYSGDTPIPERTTYDLNLFERYKTKQWQG